MNYRIRTSEAYSEPSQTSKKTIAQKIESKQESDCIKRVQYLLLELFEKKVNFLFNKCYQHIWQSRTLCHREKRRKYWKVKLNTISKPWLNAPWKIFVGSLPQIFEVWHRAESKRCWLKIYCSFATGGKWLKSSHCR